MLSTQQHSQRNQGCEDDEYDLEEGCRRVVCDDRACCDAQNCGQCPNTYDLRDHGAFFLVCDVGANGRRHNNRQRSAYACLDANIFGNAKDPKHLVQDRHDDSTAADAKKPGQDAHQDAGSCDPKREKRDLADRMSQYHLTRKISAAGSNRQAAMCANSVSLSSTNASASARTVEPAPGLTASVARCRRKARAPGTARKSPRRWRVTAWSRTPLVS